MPSPNLSSKHEHNGFISSTPSKGSVGINNIKNKLKSRSSKNKSNSKTSNNPSKLERSNATECPENGLEGLGSIEDDSAWWSDDEIEFGACKRSHKAKSSSLPANGRRLQANAANDGTSSASNGDIVTDHILSSSIKSCNDASAFESFSCTDDDDEDDGGDDSDPDTTSIESSGNNR